MNLIIKVVDMCCISDIDVHKQLDDKHAEIVCVF